MSLQPALTLPSDSASDHESQSNAVAPAASAGRTALGSTRVGYHPIIGAQFERGAMERRLLTQPGHKLQQLLEL